MFIVGSFSVSLNSILILPIHDLISSCALSSNSWVYVISSIEEVKPRYSKYLLDNLWILSKNFLASSELYKSNIRRINELLCPLDNVCFPKNPSIISPFLILTFESLTLIFLGIMKLNISFPEYSFLLKFLNSSTLSIGGSQTANIFITSLLLNFFSVTDIK